jgi:hypothetical protein
VYLGSIWHLLGRSAGADIHATLEVDLTRLGEDGQKTSRQASVEPGTIHLLWADTIAATCMPNTKNTRVPKH